MNLMLLDFKGLTKNEEVSLRCAIAYYLLPTVFVMAENLDIKTIVIQDLDKVIVALKSRMKPGALPSEKSLLIKLEALKNFEK